MRNDLLQLNMIADLVYLIAILCAKLLILFFYLAIFQINRAFRNITVGLMALTTLCLIVSFFTYLL